MDTKKLRQKILDLAIHGKLVPQDPNDEPASVLLERIRKEKEQLIKEGKIKAPKKSKSAGDTSHYPKEGPWELPEGWTWCKLEDLCTFLSRGKSPVYSESSREYPVFAQKCNLKEGGISLEKALFLNPDTLPKWPLEYRLQSGDVLVNSTGTGTVGRTRLFDKKYLGDYPFVVPDSHVSVVRTFPQISSAYIHIALSSEYGQQYFAENLAGSTNQKELYIGSIAELQIPLPPSKEQERITGQVVGLERFVKMLDEQRGLVQKSIESIKAKILELAIHGKLVPQNPTDEPAIELLRRINPGFKPSDNLHYEGELPNGWCFSTIGDLFQHNTGKALNGKERGGEVLRYITTSNLYWDRFDLSEVRTMPFTETEKEKCRATKGDLLVCEGGDVGRAAIWSYDFDVMIQNHIHRLRPKGKISVKFYYYIFLLYKQHGLIGGKGIAILGLSSRELDKLVVPVPPPAEQERIVTSIETMFRTIEEIRDSIDC